MYKINNWDKYYETSETRKWKTLKWIPVRCKLGGVGYRRLMKMDRGLQIFGCWIALLEVAAQCNPRGVFADSDGVPYTIEDLAYITDIPEDVIAETLTILSKPPFNWISPATAEDSPATAEDSPATAEDSPATASLNRIEQNRIEQNSIDGNGRKEKESNEGDEIVIENKYFSITRSEYDDFKTAYPYIDISNECKKMVAWLTANPSRRKKNYMKFVNNWLSKANEPEAEKWRAIENPPW